MINVVGPEKAAEDIRGALSRMELDSSNAGVSAAS